MTSAWQPIETYPKDHDPAPDTYWGPEVAVLVPKCKAYPYSATRYIAHLEADVWLVRDASEPECWGDLHTLPTHWMPLPVHPEPSP